MPYYLWHFFGIFGLTGELLAFRFPADNKDRVVGAFSYTTDLNIGDGARGKSSHVADVSSLLLDKTSLRITALDTKPDPGDHIDPQFGDQDGDLIQVTGAAVGQSKERAPKGEGRLKGIFTATSPDQNTNEVALLVNFMTMPVVRPEQDLRV